MKHAFFICAVAAVLSLGVYAAFEVASPPQNRPQSVRDRADLRRVHDDVIRRQPALERYEGRKLAVRLRDLVYKNIRTASDSYSFPSLWKTYSDYMITHRYGASCQGKSVTYRIILAAFGFRERSISMFASRRKAKGKALISHATADVFVDGRWEAMDPTFNVSFWHAGKPLSWVQVRSIWQHGGEVVSKTDGMKAYSSVTFEESVQDIKTASRYLASTGDVMIVLPKSWNGVVTFGNQQANYAHLKINERIAAAAGEQ